MVDEEHERPAGVTDQTVAALGKASEALEWVERARGHLYEFHQIIGRADILFGDAADALDGAGHTKLAELLRKDVLGRNVLHGRWSFQVLEEFEELYYNPIRVAEDEMRCELVGGRRHIFESEMKEQRRTKGAPGHESRPTE